MNRKSVIIKSNKYGLTVILDDKMPFQELLLDIADKFQESANFFRNAKMAVTFRGRVLNREEERQVIETIVDHCGIHILCVVDEDAVSQEHYRRILNAALEEQEKVDGLFYRGTLSNGEVLETASHIKNIAFDKTGTLTEGKPQVVAVNTAMKTQACQYANVPAGRNRAASNRRDARAKGFCSDVNMVKNS